MAGTVVHSHRYDEIDHMALDETDEMPTVPNECEVRLASFRQLLAKQLGSIQRVLAAHHNHALGVIGECMEVVQRAEERATQLETENERLCKQLASMGSVELPCKGIWMAQGQTKVEKWTEDAAELTQVTMTMQPRVVEIVEVEQQNNGDVATMLAASEAFLSKFEPVASNNDTNLDRVEPVASDGIATVTGSAHHNIVEHSSTQDVVKDEQPNGNGNFNRLGSYLTMKSTDSIFVESNALTAEGDPHTRGSEAPIRSCLRNTTLDAPTHGSEMPARTTRIGVSQEFGRESTDQGVINIPSMFGGSRAVSQASCGSASHLSEGKHDFNQLDSVVQQEFQMKCVFADAAAMKEKVRQAIGKREYHVFNFYWETGFWAGVARSQLFDNVTLLVIALNAVWIAVETDHNNAATLLDAHLFFVVGENLFCTYFFAEWIVRFMAFKRKRDGCRDAWFVFDSCLVIVMMLETWVMTVVLVLAGAGSGGGLGNASILRLARLLRLTRMARLARLLRAVPELIVLIKGIVVATRSVFFTLCLLVLVIYIFAIVFTQLTADTPVGSRYFSSVPGSMNTLLLHGTLLEDVPDVANELKDEHWIFYCVFLMFILLASLTVMNMLVGVLVEVVSIVSAVEKEEVTVNYVTSKLRHMMEASGLDASRDHRIEKSEFVVLLEKPEAARCLQEVGVDVVGMVDFIDVIFQDGSELSFPDFMEMVLQLRGSNTATVKDIVDLRKCFVQELRFVEEHVMKQIRIMLGSGARSDKSRNLDALKAKKSVRGLKSQKQIDF